ncbi:hypothetical protein D3C71_1649190 [compost metagenome]
MKDGEGVCVHGSGSAICGGRHLTIDALVTDHTKPCGSGLARDSAGSDTLDVECDGLIAGKPAPTGFSEAFKDQLSH